MEYCEERHARPHNAAANARKSCHADLESLKSGVVQPQSTVTKTHHHHNTDGDCDGALPKMLSNAHHCTRSCVRPPTSGGIPSTFPVPHVHSPDRTLLSASIAHYICTFASFGGFPVTFPRAAAGSTSSSSTRAGGCARHCSSWSRHMFLCFGHHCATDVLLGCRMSCPSVITAITCDVLHRFRLQGDSRTEMIKIIDRYGHVHNCKEVHVVIVA